MLNTNMYAFYKGKNVTPNFFSNPSAPPLSH